MKKYFGFAAALLVLAGCSEDDVETPAGEVVGGKATVIGASVQNDFDTRTYLYGSDVYWLENDVVNIFGDSESAAQTYTAQNVDGASAKLVSSGSGLSIEANTTFYAVYGGNFVSASGTSATVVLPTSQTYQTNNNGATFGKDANVMAGVMAVSELSTGSMQFKNLCGILKVKLYTDTEDVEVSSIKLVTTGSTPLSGTATVSFGDTPSLTVAAATRSELSLSGINQVLGTTEASAMEFYFVVPAGTYSNMDIYAYTNKDENGAATLRAHMPANADIVVNANTINSLTGSNGINIQLKQLKTYAVGDLYPGVSGTDNVGVVYELTGSTETVDNVVRGTAGSIVYLSALNSAVWAADDITVGVTNSTTDGAANSTALSSSTAVAECTGLTETATGVGAWYLPAQNQLSALLSNETVVTNANLVVGDYWTSTVSDGDVVYITLRNTAGTTRIGYADASGYTGDSKMVRAVAAFENTTIRE